jgi:beta-lactamase class A
MIYDCANYGSGLMAAYPNGEFTQNECRQMIELMSANDLERLLQGGIPPEVRISHKNGWIDNEHGDAGIVFSPNGRNYIIAVFLWEDVEFLSYERAWPLIEGISRATWNYFNPEQPLLAPRPDLPVDAMACEGNYLPPNPASVNLNDINAWRRGQ